MVLYLVVELSVQPVGLIFCFSPLLLSPLLHLWQTLIDPVRDDKKVTSLCSSIKVGPAGSQSENDPESDTDLTVWISVSSPSWEQLSSAERYLHRERAVNVCYEDLELDEHSSVHERFADRSSSVPPQSQ